MIVVSDTSPISNLILIGRIDILESLFDAVVVPLVVDSEIRALKALGKDIGKYEAATWIKKRAARDQDHVLQLRHRLDAGEAEAIVLARELNCDLLLIDERLGTKVAIDEGLRTLGLLGVLVEAKRAGLIGAIKSVIDELDVVAGFWITDGLRTKVLEQVGEL